MPIRRNVQSNVVASSNRPVRETARMSSNMAQAIKPTGTLRGFITSGTICTAMPAREDTTMARISEFIKEAVHVFSSSVKIGGANQRRKYETPRSINEEMLFILCLYTGVAPGCSMYCQIMVRTILDNCT